MRVKLSRPERPEQWADVRGYEGIYQISTCGNIRSLLFRNNICSVPMVRLLKPYDNGGGYLVVSLRKESRRHSRYVHRLVADTFLDKKDGCEYINHIDRNKRNNTVDNLEWCTQKQNVNHSRHNLCRPKKNMQENQHWRKVYFIFFPRISCIH